MITTERLSNDVRRTGLLRSDALSRRTGFTVMEVVVAVGVIGLLVALLLPAVQSSREAARGVTCRNHLKQISLASLQYHDIWSVLPPASEHFKRLLPHIEQTNLAEAKDAESRDAETLPVSPELYKCPSDPLVDINFLPCSYHFCSGSGNFTFEGMSFAYDGIARSHHQNLKSVAISEITDGTSSTLMYSERRSYNYKIPVADDVARSDPTAYIWFADRDYKLLEEFEQFQQFCRQGKTSTAIPAAAKIHDHWKARYVGFNTVVGPNRPGHYCVAPPSFPVFDVENGSLPASSHHSGGVFCAYADGHVQFIADGIDGETWTALSTRASGESISGDF